ncbi:MAG: tetratricopeptide repeat protein [Kofleriaceae bacterium]
MRLVSVALIAGLAGSAAAQPATSRQEAAEHFKKGQAAQAERRYRDAIDEYGAAFAIVPHANVLFNIAFCYEQLARWGEAADYYQRYLDYETATDAESVTAKIRELRAKAPPSTRPPPRTAVQPEPDPNNPPGNIGIVNPPPLVIEPERPPKWHGGFSYGLGFGDTTVERYLFHGGIRFAKRVDLDGILGGFGKNDHAIGVLTRVRLATETKAVIPFLRAAATIGYAKQDASSSAETKPTLGVEVGGGALFGARGRFEVDAVVRFLGGGFGKDATGADSFVNDSFAFAVDIGFGFDWPILARPLSM